MRKSESVKVPAWPGNRDAGKVFKITEMPAAQAEKWGVRLMLALNDSGQPIPENVQGLGMVGVAILGINTFLRSRINFTQLEPLMDEMMSCVEVVRDPINAAHVATPLVSEDDVEEVQTRAWLRGEVIRLHTGFSLADALSSLVSAVLQPRDSGNTSTSPEA